MMLGDPVDRALRQEEGVSDFPRTTVGGVSLSRMVIGTNWFMGFSHTSAAKDDYIREHVRDSGKIADILETFVKAGVDTILGSVQQAELRAAVREVEDRTGREIIMISTPHFPINARRPVEGFRTADVEKELDKEMRLGARFCMPHQCVTDAMVDRCSREVRKMDELCAMIRERGMIPGLSAHMPEAIVYADETGLDVETYVAMYNAMGFLMQIEVDWVNAVIHKAKKPVLTIKPMAAGQVRPLQALTFVWHTIRDCDMVAVGTMSPREAEELIEISLNILAGAGGNVRLQETRSKMSLRPSGVGGELLEGRGKGSTVPAGE